MSTRIPTKSPDAIRERIRQVETELRQLRLWLRMVEPRAKREAVTR